MQPVVVVFLVVNAIALLAVPRRWVALPLLIGACYMTRGQALELGAVSLTVVRILVAVAFLRMAIRQEWIAGRLNALDGIMGVWGLWMVFSVVFHPFPESPLLLRVRDLYEAWGLYFFFRVYCRNQEEIQQLAVILALVLLPIAAFMMEEKATGQNWFARFGGVPHISTVRNGVIRAQGTFAHSILAGSIGAACLPLMIGLWRERPWIAKAGIGACLAMVYASGSSGPILTVGAGLFVLALWPVREYMRFARWIAVLMYIGLEMVMRRPAYFIISDLDLMGGSTSWYRAELIRSSIAHLNEWWLVGTDYTRHWMATGVPSSPNQTDITNHYIGMGVVGGLLLMFLFMAMLMKAFWNVGTGIRTGADKALVFQSWSVGAALFAQAVTCLSVSYYDHSILFLYLPLTASIATLTAVKTATAAHAVVPLRFDPALHLKNFKNPRLERPVRPGTVHAFSPKETPIAPPLVVASERRFVRERRDVTP